MFNFYKAKAKAEDGAAIVVALMMGLVGFSLAFVMLLATIQSLNTSSAVTINNRLKTASETAISDALYLINSGYDFQANVKTNPYYGEDRTLQKEGNETSAIKWKWWVEPMDLTTKEECVKTNGPETSYFNCGYYIYSQATMPDLSADSSLTARAILLPMQVSSASKAEDGGITYASSGLSVLRNGIFGLNSFNMGNGVGLYSFASVEDPTVKKPTTPTEILEGYDGLPTDPALSTQKVSVGSNKNVIINSTRIGNSDISSYNLYRNGPLLNNTASYASCSLNGGACAQDKMNEQSFDFSLAESASWANSQAACASPVPAASFTSSTEIPAGVTCISGDVTLESNPVAGTKESPSILIIQGGNLTFSPNAKINPYTVPEALQIYVTDGNVSTSTASAAVTKIVAELVASGEGKGIVSLSTGFANSKLKFYGAIVANEIAAVGNVEIWQDTNSKFIKNDAPPHTTVYQVFSYEVVSSTRNDGLDNEFIGDKLTKGSAPSMPQNLNATAQDTGTSAVLSWDAPSINGGTSEIQYTIEQSQDGANWTPVNTTSKRDYTLTGLKKYTLYSIRVKATTPYGSSEWSNNAFLTKATSPAAPTSVTASNVTSNAATLTWVVPTDTGGKPITEYKVIYSTTSSFATSVMVSTASSSNSFQLSGLERATEYFIRVLSTTSEGNSKTYSTASLSTLQTPAGPPSINTVTTTNNSAVISWTAPEDNGGSLLTGYYVYRDGNPVNSTIIDPATTTYTITGLSPETQSSYTVVAVNKVGNGQPSTAFISSTKPNVPSAPTSLTISSYTGSGANIAWSNGGGTVTKYVAYVNGALNFESATTSGTLTGLSAGTNYALTIFAWNETGYSPSFATTFYMQPNAPASAATTNLGSTPYIANSSAFFTFTNNPCYAGTTPTYRLYQSGVSTPVATSITNSATISVPAAGSYTYYYTVSCGWSSYNTSQSAASPLTSLSVMNKPSAPSSVWVSNIFRNTATLSWNAVSGASSYTLNINGSNFTTTGTSYTVGNVGANGTYGATVYTNISSYQSTGAGTTVYMPLTYVGSGGCLSPGSWYDQRRDQVIRSGNGNYVGVMQGDGNFVAYDVSSGNASFYAATGASGTPGYLCMQGDGNLVLYRSNWTAFKATGNLAGSGHSLNIQDDSNLVVYSSAGAVWARSWGTSFM